MNRALWLLLWLQLGGWLRYLGQSLRTVRGAVLVIVGLAVFVPWLGAVLLSSAAGGGIDPNSMMRYGPALLVFYCFLNVLFSSHERAIYFTPAEVQFLFSGPFGRREVLAYKLLLTLLVSVPATLVMTLLVRVRQGWFPAMILGLLGVSIFMQLFSIALGLLANALGEQLYGRGRKVAIVVLLVLVGVIYLQSGAGVNLKEVGTNALESETYRVISAPMRSFFEVMIAERFWPDLVAPLMVSLSVLLALLGLVFLLDAHYLEAAAAASARTYAKLQRLRGRSVTVEEAIKPTLPRGTLPSFPYLGGIGPIFWRQLLSAMRGLGRLAWILLIVVVAVSFPLFNSGIGSRESIYPMLIGLGIWLTIFLTSVVPFDFRGDIDRIATLKTLPISPWALAMGQMLTPTLLLTLIQWLLMIVAFSVSSYDAQPISNEEALPPNLQRLILLAGIAFAPAFSFLVIGIENLLFLLFPVRVMAATPGDFQALGRNVLLALGKIVGLMLVGSIAAFAGVGTYLVTRSAELAVFTAWPVVTFFGLCLVPIIGLAFRWFDVGRDTPA